jgi:hypothetical protein
MMSLERPASFLRLLLMAAGACGAQHMDPSAHEPPAGSASSTAAAVTATPPTATASSVTPATDAPAPSAGPARLTGKVVPLPGAEGPAFVDYVVYEPQNARVWVPVGRTGSVDVFDTARQAFTRVDGFGTTERDVGGKKRTLGPSAVTVGEGVVYVGDRGSSEVCPVDTTTLKSAGCLKLSSPTDGVAYIAPVREVWVTMPRDKRLAILDASTPDALRAKATVSTDGAPEGYAVDESRGLFFTNLEDKGGTLAIDVKTRKVKSTWNAGCGADGPRGVAFDAAHDFVVVACTDHVQVLDAGHDGARLGKLETGAGLDNIDVLDATVYAASARAGRLTVARIDDRGQLSVLATADTSEGARNAVADGHGNVYVADSQGARLLVFAGAPAR